MREIDRGWERQALFARVGEIAEIHTMRDDRARRAETIEWLIRCAGHPATQDDAEELLAEEPGWPWPNDPEIGTFARELTAERRQRLVDALVAGGLRSVPAWQLLRLANPAPGDARVLDAVRDTLDGGHGNRLREAAGFIVNERARDRVRDVAERLLALRDETRPQDWICAF